MLPALNIPSCFAFNIHCLAVAAFSSFSSSLFHVAFLLLRFANHLQIVENAQKEKEKRLANER